MSSLDVRRPAMLVTIATVLVLGAALAWWPEAARWASSPFEAGIRTDGRAEHAEKQRQIEIRSRFDQGVVMLHAKQYEHAITAFHRVLELAPQLPEAHANMGFALLGKERFAAARDFFESATSLRHDQINGYYGLAIALKGLDDLPGALGAMRVYLHRAPADDPFRPKARALVSEWASTSLPDPSRRSASTSTAR